MDIVEPLLSLASQIYDLVEEVKANKKRCRRVAERVKALEELLRAVGRGEATQTSADVERALEELSITLKSAQELLRKYTLANWLERVLKSSSHGDEFSSINERLNDAFQILSGNLQVEHRDVLRQVFQITARQQQDELDGRADDLELKTALMDHMKQQQEKMDSMLKEFADFKVSVTSFVDTLSKPSATDEVIRMIKPEELKYEHPKQPIMTTASSEVYRGEYHGFTVAIKKYTEPVNTSPSEVRSVFNKEVATMRGFESPNILRMFGVCIQNEEGPAPQFLIIMEYCEKGSLRQVLDSDRGLSWTRKARMCLDAAQGLYRLHQPEQKSKVHGCINSSKFLVDEGYRVKLGGLELARTETSLKKTKKKQSRSLCYLAPQMLENINHPYGKETEIYSLGIVLWEVATRKKPFDNLSAEEIHQLVCSERRMEPLPDDCPGSLGDLIEACRTFDAFKRPSAGVLVDKLRRVVAQLEEQ